MTGQSGQMPAGSEEMAAGSEQMTAEQPAEQPAARPGGRSWLAVGIAAAVLALSVAAGLLAASVASGPLIFVESLSGRFSGLLLSLGTVAPLGYAFLAGMVAAVNPCGFVLLPAYLGLYLGEDRGDVGARRASGRAVVISLTVTASFVVLFGLVGAVARLAAGAVTQALPWIGAAVGAGLIVLGGVLASGRYLSAPLGPRLAQRLGATARIRGTAGYAAYGAAYGLASLGCALPVFLAVVGTSLQAHGVAGAAGQFVLYGLGMGAVISALTLLTAWFGAGVVSRLRSASRHAGWASAILLWLAGGYVVYYWLIAIRLM